MGKSQRKLALVTDTGSFITPQIAKENQIFLLPLQIIINEKTYQDLVTVETEDIFNHLRNNSTLKTSLPNYVVMEQTIREIKALGYEEIIFVPLTPGISSTCEVFQGIANEYRMPLAVVDCFTTCQIQKELVFHIHSLINDNKTTEEIMTIVGKRINESGTYILCRDLEHLKNGGRLTPLAASLATMVKIFPILQMNKGTQGKIDVYKKVRTEKRAIQTMVLDLLEELGEDEDIYILHSDDEDGALKIQDILVQNNIDKSRIKIEYLNSVIAVHVGLKCIAIQHMKRGVY